MRATDASTIFRRAWHLYNGGDWDDPAGLESPGTADFRRMAASFAARFKQAWDSAQWPDLCLTEKRYFRERWTTSGPVLNAKGAYVLDSNGYKTYADRYYAATDEVFYVPAQKYYQSLKAGNFSNKPADSSAVENSAWWAESKSSYTGNDWKAGTAYAVVNGSATIVRNPDDDEFYQCHTAHTSGAAFDATKFGLLTAFVQYVDFNQLGRELIGTPLTVADKDPRLFRNGCRVPFRQAPNRIEIARHRSSVWLKFRKPCPDLAGKDAWDITRAYLAGDIFYYTFTGATRLGAGNYQRCLYNTAAGENPDNFANKFEDVEIPTYFEEFLARAVAADLHETDAEDTEAVGDGVLAVGELSDSIWNYLAIPDEERETLVATR